MTEAEGMIAGALLSIHGFSCWAERNHRSSDPRGDGIGVEESGVPRKHTEERWCGEVLGPSRLRGELPWPRSDGGDSTDPRMSYCYQGLKTAQANKKLQSELDLNQAEKE
ncbi:hypothetical protein TREES_T100014592 [Tupaia chinensis]|uniref:Uncharacterized protein n=1 Tax=Tupaia chinensis TaxID=246437 RepID=L9L356_TUPCH|nr:hypothetical protein TREES_T100014592 [Tupaia chinensis]